MENISGVADEGSHGEIGPNYEAGSRQGHWRSLVSSFCVAAHEDD